MVSHPAPPTFLFMGDYRMVIMFDFNVFNSEKLADDGAVLHLAHPVTLEPVYIDDNQKKPCEIILMGSDSDVYLEFQQKKLNERSKNKSNDKIDFKKSIRESADVYAKMTKGWANIWHEGKELEFNYKNAVMIYMTYKEIRVQVGDFISEKENFIKG